MFTSFLCINNIVIAHAINELYIPLQQTKHKTHSFNASSNIQQPINTDLLKSFYYKDTLHEFRNEFSPEILQAAKEEIQYFQEHPNDGSLIDEFHDLPKDKLSPEAYQRELHAYLSHLEKEKQKQEHIPLTYKPGAINGLTMASIEPQQPLVEKPPSIYILPPAIEIDNTYAKEVQSSVRNVLEHYFSFIGPLEHLNGPLYCYQSRRCSC